jgi:hypothetical protein
MDLREALKKEIVMKRITAITLILAAGFVTAGSALAQEQKVAADIPFKFTLEGRTLPAGHYTIVPDAQHPNVLRIEDQQDSVSVMAMVEPESSAPRADNKLTFHRYGNQYFLSAIHVNGSSMNCSLATSKQEKWAIAQVQSAALRANDNVTIALK